jgi:ribosomal protein S4
MRLYSKYKIFAKTNTFTKKFPIRILKFRRPKWSRLQKLALLSKQRSNSFVTQLFIKNSIKSWDKIRQHYKEGVVLKNSVYRLFDSAVSYSWFKKKLIKNKQLNKTSFLVNGLIQPMFRIDILLVNLNFFATSYQAKQALNSHKIKVNGQTVTGNYLVKKGDIIFYKSLDIPFFFKRNLLNELFFSFVEIDAYTKTVVVIKDYEDLSTDDFNLLLTEYFDLNKFKNSLI